ncbi:hypothetical protein [Methylobacterium durans]|nr:hypothetical protein [Methylobacterium durans]
MVKAEVEQICAAAASAIERLPDDTKDRINNGIGAAYLEDLKGKS